MADGPVEISLYSLPLPVFKAEIHERISKALPGPSFSISPEDQVAFKSALQNLHSFLQANVHGLVSQKSMGAGRSFTWKGSIAERRFLAALPILAEAGVSSQAPKKAPSMPSVLSAPANMERMVEHSAPASAFNLDFLPTFGGPSPPTSAGSSPLHPQSQGLSSSQPSILRPPRPGASSAVDALNPFSDSPSAGQDDRNPFNSPTRSDGPASIDGPPGQNPFDTISRESSAALQPILDKIPDLSFMLSDKLAEPLAPPEAVPAANGAAAPRTSVDEWGDFSGQSAALSQDVVHTEPTVSKATTNNDAWGDFSIQPSNVNVPTSGPQTAMPSRASTDEWGDFNG